MSATPVSTVPEYDSERGYGPSTEASTSGASHSATAANLEKRHAHAPAPYAYAPYDDDGYAKRPRSMSFQSLGRAIASRGLRMVRRGNLPFFIVFVTALFVFFGALAGVGYVDPDATDALKNAGDPEFVLGGPVFDPSENQRMRDVQLAEQRERELAWQKRKRPNVAAWMHKHRDDGSVRLRPGQRDWYEQEEEWERADTAGSVQDEQDAEREEEERRERQAAERQAAVAAAGDAEDRNGKIRKQREREDDARAALLENQVKNPNGEKVVEAAGDLA